MRLSPATICPICEASALLQAFSLRPTVPFTARQWKSSRNLGTLQKRARQPSRMILSERVARSPTATTPDGKEKPTTRRSRNSPWGGMNRTTVPREVQQATAKKTSAAEHKRRTREFLQARSGKPEKERADPMKALKMQRALANVSYEKRGRVKEELADRDTFADFDLLRVIQDSISPQALGGLTDVSPTPIQRLAIPAILGQEDGKRRKQKTPLVAKKGMQPVLLAAETGSGKTLAYVLPVIDAIKRAELAEMELEKAPPAAAATISEEASNYAPPQPVKHNPFALPSPDTPHPTSGRPRAIILLPTSELVSQVGALTKSLSHTVKFRSAMISSSLTGTVIRNRLFSPSGIDILISTPHLLQSITESDPNVLSRVTHLIIDEADSLLDRSFSPITSSIIDRCAPSLHRLILCSATIPKSLDSFLNKRYPEVTRLVTPNLHAIPRRVQLSVVDIEKVPYQGNRDLACAQTIWDIGKEAAEAGEEFEKKIVVFVNEREKTIELAEYLRSKGIDASALSRDSDERKLAETLGAFTGSPSAPRTKSGASPASPASLRATKKIEETAAYSPSGLTEPGQLSRPTIQSLKNTKVLVMTDIGSRGIDTLLVRHVVLYDVPHTSIDFIHRLGRVGRMGRRGRGIVLVGKHDRRDVVREVREGMFKGQALI
ncbi:related to RNA helicase, mitochondrial [Ramularia collo-cygni]|uniref:RNA helicase n=1 Tax=Ramularia collo-cygni TaxID=112498 RepID=A0A2D3UM71_9PEZI|nr:related to RNA helicase, mitochondrial [Ramularia collo-cygni]CZT14911.1 related to RNA helicase, mitochondrial [Ramularia collo-cygni]